MHYFTAWNRPPFRPRRAAKEKAAPKAAFLDLPLVERSFAIGPSIRYDSGKGWFLTAKYQKETGVRNRAEGAAFWLKAVMPF